MEIEFNPSRVSNNKLEYSAPLRSRVAQTDNVKTEVKNPAVAELVNQLNTLSTVRPEKIAEAKALLSNDNYPPNYVLDRIASLLAANLKE